MTLSIRGADDEELLGIDADGVPGGTIWSALIERITDIEGRLDTKDEEAQANVERFSGIDETTSSAAGRLTSLENINGGSRLTSLENLNAGTRLGALEAAPAIVSRDANFTLAIGEHFVKITKTSTTCVVTLPAANTWTGGPVSFKLINAIALNSNASNVKPLNSNVAAAPIVASKSGGGGWAVLVADVPGNVWEVFSSS